VFVQDEQAEVMYTSAIIEAV